jgi:hypothetical protein
VKTPARRRSSSATSARRHPPSRRRSGPADSYQIESSLYSAGGAALAIQTIELSQDRAVFGYQGSAIASFDGARFVTAAQTRNVLRAIAGNGSLNDVWAAGEEGELVSFDGSNFHERSFGSHPDLLAVFATSGNEQWAGGFGGALLHGISGQFETVAPGAAQLESSIFSIDGSGPSDVWAGGEAGLLRRYDGSRWADQSSQELGDVERIISMGQGNVWFLTAGNGPAEIVSHFDGASISKIADFPQATVFDAWGTSFDDTWFASSGGLYHFDGSGFATTTLERLLRGGGRDEPQRCLGLRRGPRALALRWRLLGPGPRRGRADRTRRAASRDAGRVDPGGARRGSDTLRRLELDRAGSAAARGSHGHRFRPRRDRLDGRLRRRHRPRPALTPRTKQKRAWRLGAGNHALLCCNYDYTFRNS